MVLPNVWPYRLLIGFFAVALLSLSALYYQDISLSQIPNIFRKPLATPLNCSNATPTTGTALRHEIPNILHLVWVAKDPSADLQLTFSHFLTAYAAAHHLQPDTIYLHTNAEPASIARVRAAPNPTGPARWSQRILALPALQVEHVVAPTHANNGQPLVNLAHVSDFVRMDALYARGGLYIDWDVRVLRSLAPLRAAGFAAVVGREFGGGVNSGVLLAAPRSALMRAWWDGMHSVFDPAQYALHSTGLLSLVAETTVPSPEEVLIVDHAAFHPGGFVLEDAQHLFGPSALADEKQRTPWEWQTRWPADFAPCYTVHAFASHKNITAIFGQGIEGFEQGITPAYVYRRGSRFARLMFPMVEMMMEAGLVTKEDVGTS